MYLDHYGFKEPPFSLAPDPECLYPSKKHNLCLSLLQYGVSDAVAGLTVITGAVGAGKTTLVQMLLKKIDYDFLNVGVINNTFAFDENLMSWVVSAFNLVHEDKDQIVLFREFQQYLINEYAVGKRTLIIIDEAQNLSEKSLEQLRLLTNINVGKDQLLKIILVGQPELLALLSQPQLSQIAQRVSVEYHLDTLSCADTGSYIRHRLEKAGGNPELFSEIACDVIYCLSGGVPRLINTLCDYSLVYGFANGLPKIGFNVVLESAAGRQLGGINHQDCENAEVRSVRDSVAAQNEINFDALFPKKSPRAVVST